jgi:uncharacterized protein (UPF0332 family)
MQFNKEEYKKIFGECLTEGTIRKSNQLFKIRLFLQKAENSLLIAKHHKEIQPTKDMPKKLYWDYWAISISYYSMLYAAKAAILSKGYEVKTHDSTQIALGHLLVPDQIEKEDLELLDQSYKIFEDEYVKYFEDAKIESHIARYSAIKTYTQRRLDEIFNNATKFIAKISLKLNEEEK